ncbi:50S ribosomal protein L12 [ANME-1 cluster archaeon GoMg3.2]|nr:50S ribosomal protein L12 [ANME-1 cluster archaeon GoMg3.2]
MEYIYAALLLHDSGKEVTEDGMTAVMKAAGVEAEIGRVKALISALNDVDIDEAMAQAQPAYAAAAPAMPAQAPAAAPAPEAGEAEKKEKKEKTAEEEEKAEETGMEGLSSLFG